LHVSPFGAILSLEQADVHRFLLADSPFAPAPGARTRLQAQKEPKHISRESWLLVLFKTENLDLITEN
jgi:hypothetical protein